MTFRCQDRALSVTVDAQLERWPLVKPFRISGRSWNYLDAVRVELRAEGATGHGEAAGVYYNGETAPAMLLQIGAVRREIEGGASRASLQKLLPPGGARNALDCAFWDLEARLSGRSVWQLAGLSKPRSLLTTFTCGADTPANMAATARSYKGACAIKLKLTGESCDADRVRAVRDALPDVWLAVDANQGLTQSSFVSLLPALIEARVQLIEQPLPVGQESVLESVQSPIPIAADESVQRLADVDGLVGRFSALNIKLDKCGGLTEALAMVRRAQALGIDCMVGNMLGTSLAMAPAYLVGQLCKIVDLDGPVFLASDRTPSVSYVDGYISCPPGVRCGAGSTACDTGSPAAAQPFFAIGHGRTADCG